MVSIIVHLAAGGAVALPVLELTTDTLQPGDTLVGLRGYAYTLAVLRDGHAVGYCAVEATSFKTVKEWLGATKGKQIWTK